MNFKSISKATYERNKKAGAYLEIISETATGAHVVPRQVRGNYRNEANTGGATVVLEFTVPPLTEREVRDQVLAKIAALDLTKSFPLNAQYVVEMFKGVSRNVWTEIDNRGGNAALPSEAQAKFHIVRQVRNHPEWHKPLFAGIK